MHVIATVGRRNGRRQSFSGRSSLSCVYSQPRPGSLRRLFCTQESSRPFDGASPDRCGHRATSSGASKLSSHLAWEAPRQIAILSHDSTARRRVEIALLVRCPAHRGGLWHWRTCDHLADMMRLEVLFSAVLRVVFTETLRRISGCFLGFRLLRRKRRSYWEQYHHSTWYDQAGWRSAAQVVWPALSALHPFHSASLGVFVPCVALNRRGYFSRTLQRLRENRARSRYLSSCCALAHHACLCHLMHFLFRFSVVFLLGWLVSLGIVLWRVTPLHQS